MAPADLYLPRLAVDGDGNATAVWYEFEFGSLAQVSMNRFLVGSGWGAPKVVCATDTDGLSEYPVAAVGANAAGQTFALWGIDSY